MQPTSLAVGQMQTPRTFDEALSHCDAASVPDSLTVGIAVLDAHFRLTYANQVALELLTITPQDARGRPFASLFRDSFEFTHALRAAMNCGQRRSMKSLRLLPANSARGKDPVCSFNVEIKPMDGFTSDTYLLLQLALPESGAAPAQPSPRRRD